MSFWVIGGIGFSANKINELMGLVKSFVHILEKFGDNYLNYDYLLIKFRKI